MSTNCAICYSKRANIRLLQCGHTIHDRCLFPWPCKYCPVTGCHQEISNFECMKIEAFDHNGTTYECPNLMRVFGINRRGRWTEEEYEYALALIEAFNAGLVHLPESLKLGSFLCKMLQCCAARLSSKIRKGKKVFHSKRMQEGTAVDSYEIAHYRSVQQKLSDAEQEFLNKIAVSFDPEEASVLSYHIQHSWQKGFLSSSHFDMSKQMLRSCGTPSIPSASSFCRENKLFDQLRSVAYRFVSWPLEGSAFLLLEEIASAYPNTIALAVNIHTHEVVHVSSQLQAIVSQFLGKDSFLTLNDLEFIFKNHNELVQIVLTPPAEHSSSNSSDRKHQRFQRTAEMVLVDDDKCICAVDTMFLGSISLSTLRFRRFPLRSSVGETEEELEEEEENRTLTHAFSEGPSLKSNKSFHGSGCFSAVRTSSGYQDVSVGGSKKNRQDAGSRAYDTGTQSRSIEASKRPQSTSSSSSSNYSSSAMSLQMACGTFLLTSDKHLVPQQIGDNLYRPSVVGQESNFCDNFNSLLVEGGEEGEMEITSGVHTEEILSRNPIVNIVFSGGSRKSGGGKTNPVLTSSANEDAPTLLSATTTVDLPTYPRIPRGPNGQPNVPLSFDSILQSFLRVIPFHVMEIWVPVQLENGSTVLLYGASGALDKELLGWSSYSRNFSFNPDVGLPGRVATARTAESRTDVAKLPMPTFLRAEMAGSLGIHAACGLPFFTGNKCDAVVVFYSRHIFEPTPSLIEYMGRICESLNIRAQIRILKPQGMAAYGGDRTKYL